MSLFTPDLVYSKSKWHYSCYIVTLIPTNNFQTYRTVRDSLSRSNIKSCFLSCIFGTYAKMQRKVHKAQDSVEGPVLVLVVMCSWQWTQVKVTGPSESSVGTTSWVATGPGARCSGPTTEKMAKIHETHKIRKYNKTILMFENGQNFEILHPKSS